MKNFFTQLNNMLTAIAYAESGDFDAVKQILQAKNKDSQAPEDKEFKGISDGHAELPAF